MRDSSMAVFVGSPNADAEQARILSRNAANSHRATDRLKWTGFQLGVNYSSRSNWTGEACVVARFDGDIVERSTLERSTASASAASLGLPGFDRLPCAFAQAAVCYLRPGFE